jgi:hypothetical protein
LERGKVKDGFGSGGTHQINEQIKSFSMFTNILRTIFNALRLAIATKKTRRIRTTFFTTGSNDSFPIRILKGSRPTENVIVPKWPVLYLFQGISMLAFGMVILYFWE